jgi:hypothetical protein
MRAVMFVGLLTVSVFVSGCGCGDRAAIRQVQLTELYGSNSGPWGPIEVDLSQLPADAVLSRVEKNGSCGAPITEIRIQPNQPFKVVIVPIAQTK